MKKPSRKYYVKKCDTSFSGAVRRVTIHRLGEMCPFCGKEKIQCCFHFITRSCYNTRWDFENAIGSCCGCNFLMESRPHKFITWFIEKRGLPAWEAMVRRSNIIAKFDNYELLAMAESFDKIK